MNRWTEERANTWYQGQPWLVGTNFVPSDAINQFEMLQDVTWNPALEDKGLGIAESIGMNTMRVFLQDQMGLESPARSRSGLMPFSPYARSITFVLCLCSSIRVGTLCPNRDHNIRLRPAYIIPAGCRARDAQHCPTLLRCQGCVPTVQGVVKAFANDERILAWDVWNEPDNPNRN